MLAERVSWSGVRKIGSRLTTPLHPDDYLSLINPLWTARELRGRIEKVIPETEDAATIVIRPGWGWRYDHKPGQYVGIGIQVKGKFHWRSYSVSSVPKRDGRTIAITVRAMPEGFLSSHLVKGLEPGTIIRLAEPNGDFVLPEPPPEKILFLVAGSGITPGDGDAAHARPARDDARRGGRLQLADQGADDLPRRDRRAQREAREADAPRAAHRRRRHARDEGPRAVCPDWKERETWACGPAPMLDAAEEHWKEADLEDSLHLERFTLELGGDGGEGGTITFRNSNKTTEADGATTVMEAGEEAGIGMPYGCRMGICHTCTLTLVEGTVRDLRSGDETSGPNEPIQTCITAAAGDCTLDI